MLPTAAECARIPSLLITTFGEVHYEHLLANSTVGGASDIHHVHASSRL